MSEVPNDRAALDTQDLVTRIQRQVAESGKLIAEQQKLLAEEMKLASEARKLASESKKLDRDHWLSPVVVLVALLGGLLTVYNLAMQAIAHH